MSDSKLVKDYSKVKSVLLEKYPALTEEDFEQDSEEKLIIHLKEKLGKTRDEIRTIIMDIQG